MTLAELHVKTCPCGREWRTADPLAARCGACRPPKTVPCTGECCRARDVDGEEQTQILAPVHELVVADGQVLTVSWSIERGGVFMGEVRSDGFDDDPDLVVTAASPRELVRRLGRYGGAVSLALQLRLEHDRLAVQR